MSTKLLNYTSTSFDGTYRYLER